jgi:hypothetical protein
MRIREWSVYDNKIQKMTLTQNQAEQIKDWRCVHEYSWRKIAEMAHETFPDLRDQITYGHQKSGIELCNSAMTYLNETNKDG